MRLPWAAGFTERYLADVRLFASGVPTHLGILHQAGHPEPWIIAMDCAPNRAADWGVRAGQEDAREHPTPLEKKLKHKPTLTIGPLENSPAAPCPGSSVVCGCSGDASKRNDPCRPSIASAR